MAENLVGKLISQDRPSDKEIFEYPYVLAKEQRGTEKKNFVSISGYDSTFSKTRDNLVQALWRLGQMERSKELLFIEEYLKQVEKGDPNFAFELRLLLSSDQEGRLSKAIQAIQLYRMQQFDAAQSIEDNLDGFLTRWKKISNQTFMRAATKAADSLTEADYDITIEQLIDKIEEEARKEFSEELLIQYGPFISKMFAQVKKLSKNKFAQEYFSTIEMMRESEYIQGKIEKHKKRGSEKDKKDTVHSIIAETIKGYINGLSAEVFLEHNKVGKGTGRVGMAEKRVSKNLQSEKEGRAIQTDVIEIFSYGIEQPDIDLEEIETENIETLSALREWLGTIDLKDRLIIHTSVKDYGESSKDIHIRGIKPLDVRLAPLVEICEQVGQNKEDIQNLIFALVNAGDYMIAHDLYKNGILAQALATVSLAYMFEDYVETFGQLTTNQFNNEMHVYFINGHYYTVSDILYKSAQQIEERLKRGVGGIKGNIVRVSLIPTKENVFKDKSLNELSTREKWDKTRELVLNKSRMGVAIKAEQLKSLVFGS